MKISDLLNEATLTEATKTVWGLKFSKSSKQRVQFTTNKMIAKTLQSYHPTGDNSEVAKFSITFSKPAKNADVHKAWMIVNKSEDEDDVQEFFGSNSEAEVVASDNKITKQLQKMGFDAYADRAPVENSEPMQFVVFDAANIQEA